MSAGIATRHWCQPIPCHTACTSSRCCSSHCHMACALGCFCSSCCRIMCTPSPSSSSCCLAARPQLLLLQPSPKTLHPKPLLQLQLSTAASYTPTILSPLKPEYACPCPASLSVTHPSSDLRHSTMLLITVLCCSQLLFQPPDSTLKKSSMRSAQRPGSGICWRR